MSVTLLGIRWWHTRTPFPNPNPNSPGLCLIEWPERLGSYLPPTRLEIRIHALDESSREVAIRPVGSGWPLDLLRTFRRDHDS